MLRRAIGLPLLAVLIGAGGVGSTRSAEGYTLLEQQEWTMKEMRSIGICFEAFKLDNGSYPGRTDEYAPVQEILSSFEPVYIRSMPLKDAWDNALLYRSDGTSYAILSMGTDEVMREQPPNSRGEVGTDQAGADIIWANGDFVQFPAQARPLLEIARQQETMRRIRMVASGIASLRKTIDGFPQPTDGEILVIELRALEPALAVSLHAEDAWGRPLHYWSNGDRYRIVSNGRDGVQDRPYEEIPVPNRTSRFESDIVFEDGEFVQWPDGPQH